MSIGVELTSAFKLNTLFAFIKQFTLLRFWQKGKRTINPDFYFPEYEFLLIVPANVFSKFESCLNKTSNLSFAFGKLKID